jgi:cytochrome c2
VNISNWHLILIFFCFTPLYAETLQVTFKLEGRPVRTLKLNNIDEYTESREITVYEPHEHRDKTYIGFDFLTILRKMYGDEFDTDRDLLIKCRDGYQPSIPVLKFIEYNSYLIYKIKDQDSFSIINRNQGNEFVELGPFYLVWDNLKHKELIKYGSYDFPYQIIEFDLISFNNRFPKMSPPEKSSMEVIKGFLAFRKYCSTCHTINGEGSEKSIELNYPVNVTEYFKTQWLRKWIENPSTIRFNTKMPALSIDIDNKNQLVDQIIRYLEVMRDNKKTP